MTADEPTRVAIACQGGGSHTAFTAGVLQRLLAECDWERDYDLVGISGSSGGAFNALATWYGLVAGDEQLAIDLLDGLWDGLAATDSADRILNTWVQTASRLEASGMALPRFSPYQLSGDRIGKDRIRAVLEEHIDFESIPGHCQQEAPELVVGTVNVNAGTFETFVNEDVIVDAILASAAVPDVFEAVELDGQFYWDGMFSQNPPVHDLMHQPPGSKPEELWIIQINPQEFEGEPSSLEAIADRRNELSGNISLNQELGFIEQINEWVEEGMLPGDSVVQTDIHRIQMGKRYPYTTKLDRSPDFLAELMDLGHDRAQQFLDGRPQ